MTKKELEAYFSRNATLIDRELRKILPRRDQFVPNLHDGIEYALGLDEQDVAKHGKRYRPILCLLTSEMLGTDTTQAIPFAVAVEIMHNYCLVHDDIEDGDTVRRGRDAVWKKYGLAHGINIGDYMICKVFDHVMRQQEKKWSAEVTSRLIKLMVESLDHTLKGQALDIGARDSRATTIDEYMRIVRLKTGHCLAAPIVGGAVIAGADDSMIKAVAHYAEFVGPLFQIMDDIIDLTVGKGRNETGADIKEGKRSFLVVYLNEHCTRKEAREVFDILDKPRRHTSRKDINRIKELFDTYNVIEAGYVLCRELKKKSLHALRNVPRNLRDALSTFSEILSERVR